MVDTSMKTRVLCTCCRKGHWVHDREIWLGIKYGPVLCPCCASKGRTLADGFCGKERDPEVVMAELREMVSRE